MNSLGYKMADNDELLEMIREIDADHNGGSDGVIDFPNK
jgi:hypothetical protein